MKRIITVVVLVSLTGCVAQPCIETPVQDYPLDCVQAVKLSELIARISIPLVDACIAGNRLSCSKFAIVLERYQPVLIGERVVQCLETGEISSKHPAVVSSMTVIPEFTRKMKQLKREFQR